METKFSNIDHEFTKEIVCPYCGYEHSDSWEFRDNENEFNCYKCDKEFYYTRNITVDYSTKRISN